jgi:DNA-binding MarR family transcriptional regulator
LCQVEPTDEIGPFRCEGMVAYATSLRQHVRVVQALEPKSQAAARPGTAPSDATRQLRSAVQEFVRSFGLLEGDQTPCGQPLALSHAHALMVLAGADRGGARTSQQALASALGIDKSNVARLCAKMERLGHIDQERPVADGRARLVGLTGKGRRIAERVDAASLSRFQKVLEAMPSARVRERAITTIRELNAAVALLERTENDA